MRHSALHACRIDRSGRVRRSGAPARPFPWWSFGKTVIAVLALKQAEAGALTLDAPIDGRTWTLRQLLAHTAGLPDYGGIAEYHEAVAAREPAWPRARLLEIALADGVLFEPGAGWAYSNIGYMLAVEEIERGSGKSLATLVAEHVAAPLGLASVAVAQSTAQIADLGWPGSAGYDPAWVYHGCLIGSADDAASLLRALVDGRLLRHEALQAMHAARDLGGAIPGRPWTSHGYALGLMSGTMEGVGRAVGHSGGGPFGVCAVYAFPDLEDAPCIAGFLRHGEVGAVEAAVARDARRA